MPVPKLRPTVLTLKSKQGRLVHATSQDSTSINRTYCGRACTGWALQYKHTNCPKCLSKMGGKR